MVKPIFIWQEKALVKINPMEVICLSTERNYTRIFLTDKTFYMVRASLGNALKKFPADVFLKINRSFVASIFHIEQIERDHLLINGQPIPIGKQYYSSLIEQLSIIE